MTKQIIVQVDETLCDAANEVLDVAYLDIQSAVTMYLKRIVKEQSISFMYQNSTRIGQSLPSSPNIRREDTVTLDSEKITKSKAVRLLTAQGNRFGNNITFASKNSTANNYWANPKVDVLTLDWSLILNDYINKKLYLFFIPANTIHYSRLTMRTDKPELIDLQIAYRDTTFTDNRSGFCFKPYFVQELYY